MDVPFRERGTYRFGAFTLDPDRRALTRSGETVPLRQLLFEALRYLVIHQGRVVGRDELFEAVWGGRTVDDNNLGQTISALRRALRDAGAGDVIVTIPGRGYQFGAPVLFEPLMVEPGPPAVEIAASAATVAGPVSPAEARHRVMGWRAIVASGCVAALVAFVVTARFRHAAFAPPPHSVAVLAFANLSGDPAQDYLSDGLADELIGQLSRVGALHVAARASAFTFKGGNATVADMAHRLNVGAVLEGSVRSSAQTLNVSARLIDGASGYVIWTRDFDGARRDMPRVEGDIADAVAGALQAKLGIADRTQLSLGGTTDPEALDAYLHGAQLYTGGDFATGEQALAALQAAVHRDPSYAQAYVKLGAALAFLVQAEQWRDDSWLAARTNEAMASVRKAIALAPKLGAAHAQMASLLNDFDADPRGAMREAEQAAMLAPGDSRVQQDVSYVLSGVGHHAEAKAAASAAVALDPLSPAAYRQLALTLLEGRDFAAAQTAVQHALQIEPAATEYDRSLQARIALGLGHPSEALRLATGLSGWVKSMMLAIAYHQLGRDDDARRALERLQKETEGRDVIRYADVYAQWGRTQDALKWLNEAVHNHDTGLARLKADYALDPVASTADFKAIEQRLDFPP